MNAHRKVVAVLPTAVGANILDQDIVGVILNADRVLRKTFDINVLNGQTVNRRSLIRSGAQRIEEALHVAGIDIPDRQVVDIADNAERRADIVDLQTFEGQVIGVLLDSKQLVARSCPRNPVNCARSFEMRFACGPIAVNALDGYARPCYAER
ncbi:hypothetical protein [Sphingomonas sp. 37zxx]|uniref:hypothetical protein n=1 Tax=Sphingomonas sp. 37zxx TaxID=1550073 RepID=UPI0012E03444|nr:hypothetical protein [Sphingomonas sp. 37zxx]